MLSLLSVYLVGVLLTVVHFFAHFEIAIHCRATNHVNGGLVRLIEDMWHVFSFLQNWRCFHMFLDAHYNYASHQDYKGSEIFYRNAVQLSGEGRSLKAAAPATQPPRGAVLLHKVLDCATILRFFPNI